MKYFSLLTAALLLYSAPVAAQHPISLDFSFGNEGIVTTEFGADVYPVGSAVLADGKIAILATLSDNGERSLLLMRFHPNGTPDVSFGNEGRIVNPMPEQVADYILHVKFYSQTGGFLISSKDQNTGHAYIARFLPNGNLDTSFGNGGAFEGNPSACEHFYRIELLPNGRILAAGVRCSPASGMAILLIRLNANGSRDLAFGSGGSALASLQNASLEVTALALQPDGKILAAGYNSNLGTPQFITFRFLSGGTLDSSFGFAGRKMGLQGIPGSILVQSDGKIVVCGGIDFLTPSLWAMERYMPNGTGDPGFGSNGRVAASPPGALSGSPQALLLSDGKLLMYGTWELKITMMRYHANGSLDTGFGSNGMAQPDFGEPAFLMTMIPIQDKLLLSAGIRQDDLLLGRCTANGNIDETFGQAGAVITDLGSEYLYPGHFVELPDGRMVAAATMGNHVVLVRYQPNGDIDETFGEAGRASAILPPYYYPESPHISLDPQGGIIASVNIKEAFDRPYRIHLIRFHPWGSVDGTFGDGGAITFIFDPGNSYCSAISVLADGKILLAGRYQNPALKSFFALARMLADGRPDTSFGSAGKVVLQTPQSAICRAMHIQADGKILLSGQSGARLVTARLLPEGMMDISFGQAGWVETVQPGEWWEARDIVTTADGAIVVAGTINNDLGFARYLSNGAADLSFANSGVFRAELSYPEVVRLAPIPSEGGFLLAGSYYLNRLESPVFLMRLNKFGDPHPDFGPDGIVLLSTSPRFNSSSVRFLPDNKFVIIGAGGGVLVLVRFQAEIALVPTGNDPQRIALKVFPNPAGATITLEFELTATETVRICMLDQQGRVQQTFPVLENLPAGVHRETLSLQAGLPAGVYWLQLITGSEQRQAKVIRH